MSATSPTPRPRAFRLQFSLRLALIALTAFAIGFSIWYRWPYEETVVRSAPGFLPTTTITTWRRQWGGGKLKDGPEKMLIGGAVNTITTYRNGRKHGPFTACVVTTKAGVRTSDMANLSDRGQYVEDRKEGLWTGVRDIGEKGEKIRVFSTWHRGLLDGPVEYYSWPLGRRIRLVFAAGRLVEFDGQPARHRLFNLCASEKFAVDGRVQEMCQALGSPGTFGFVEQPLKDVIEFLKDRYGVPIALDPKVPDSNLPITYEAAGLDLCSALALFTPPHDLGFDYRYGCIWITTASDAEDWHDPTGITDVRPLKGSALARAWDEPASCSVIQKPLAAELQSLATRMAIEIDTSAIESSNPLVTCEVKDSLPNVLGQILYRSGCRCRLEGEMFVILPPESISARADRHD